MNLPKLTLVLGGAASGKSDYAENLVLQVDPAPIYIATAQIFDDEMAEKAAAHRTDRGSAWTTIEEPTELPDILVNIKPDQAVLIDCATMWLSNIFLANRDVVAASEDLIMAIQKCAGWLVIVSNEVGYGIVPDNALARRFRNAQGKLNQLLAAEADQVTSVVAGLPLHLKCPQ